MLISEEFLLLVTSPEGKWLAASNAVPLALAGGLLAELALQGKVTVDHRDHIVVVDRSSPSDLVLADALSTFAAKEGKKPKDVLGTVAKGLGDRLYDRLAGAGVVEVHKVRLLALLGSGGSGGEDRAIIRAVRGSCLRKTISMVYGP
jgi:hypothetical protein